MDCIVRGIFQARILQWAAFPFSRGSSPLRHGTQVPRVAGRFFNSQREEGGKSQYPSDKHNGVITQLEPDILECEVKLALGSITTKKDS